MSASLRGTGKGRERHRRRRSGTWSPGPTETSTTTTSTPPRTSSPALPKWWASTRPHASWTTSSARRRGAPGSCGLSGPPPALSLSGLSTGIHRVGCPRSPSSWPGYAQICLTSGTALHTVWLPERTRPSGAINIGGHLWLPRWPNGLPLDQSPGAGRLADAPCRSRRAAAFVDRRGRGGDANSQGLDLAEHIAALERELRYYRRLIPALTRGSVRPARQSREHGPEIDNLARWLTDGTRVIGSLSRSVAEQGELSFAWRPSSRRTISSATRWPTLRRRSGAARAGSCDAPWRLAWRGPRGADRGHRGHRVRSLPHGLVASAGPATWLATKGPMPSGPPAPPPGNPAGVAV